MDRILVPLDGSAAAEAIFPHVVLLARRMDAEVLFFRAVLPPVASLSGFVPVVPASEEMMMRDLRPAEAELARQGVRVRTVTRIEGAVPAIVQVAREQRVSLIAMATQGRTNLCRRLLGGICEGVLRESPVPVFVLRPLPAATPRPAGRAFRNLLVPLDDRSASLSILPAACGFATLFGSRLVLLHVFDPRKAAGHWPGEAMAPLETAARQCAAQGLRSRIVVDAGEVRERILSRIRSEDIDLVAMTTHGRSGLSRLLFGGVSGGILRRAEVPLLLCREWEEAGGEERPAGRRAYGDPSRLKAS